MLNTPYTLTPSNIGSNTLFYRMCFLQKMLWPQHRVSPGEVLKVLAYVVNHAKELKNYSSEFAMVLLTLCVATTKQSISI